MNNASFVIDHYALYLDSDPMLDLFAQEDEQQAVSDFHNGFLCTVD